MLNTPSKLKPKLFLLAILLLAAGFGYRYRDELKNLEKVFLAKTVAPCAAPITYKVGSFDSRFNISEDKFKQAISDAAQIWNSAVPSTAANHQLFQYQENGAMPVNLVYDSRQQATDQLRKLNLSVNTSEASYNQLKNTYLGYRAKYQTLDQQYQAAKQQYDAAKKAYEAEVAYWNSRGGAPKDEVQKLNAERDSLNAMANNLNQQVAALNSLAESINALAVTLNRIGAELNLDVSAYNVAGKNLGEFEEGLYTSNGLSQSIDIYQFDNYQALVRVLAHELGHSLGLEHVDDANAIMYRLNQSKNSKPTTADIAELKRVCGF